MGDKTRGLFRKFIVRRTDGTSEAGQKHDGCEYFVLDLTHDPFAKAAAEAYVDACKAEYPMLAADMTRDFKLTPHESTLADLRRQGEWQPMANAPKRKKVLVSWLNALGHRRTTCAIWYDAGELTMDDDVPDDLVDAGGDNAEGGWFEDCTSREPSYWPLNEALTHWRPLPDPPKEGQ